LAIGDRISPSLVRAMYASPRALEFQNAGHTAPLLYRPSDDRFREIPANAPALGILDDISAGPCPSISVREGDFLVCYTDGVTERHDRSGNLFGEDRVKDVVRRTVRNKKATPSDIVTAIRTACERHADDLPPRDDVTIVAARF
jgi:sigma-B regulation protein RsbU (phosphoserine phosphatase)